MYAGNTDEKAIIGKLETFFGTYALCPGVCSIIHIVVYEQNCVWDLIKRLLITASLCGALDYFNGASSHLLWPLPLLFTTNVVFGCLPCPFSFPVVMHSFVSSCPPPVLVVVLLCVVVAVAVVVSCRPPG